MNMIQNLDDFLISVKWIQMKNFSLQPQQRLKVFLTGAIEEASLIFSTGKLSQEQKFLFFFFYLNSV